MKKYGVSYMMVLVSFAFMIYLLGCNKAGQKQLCYCPDGTVKVQARTADGSGWEPCDCPDFTIWNDPATNLSWQDPHKDAFTPDDTGLTQKDAIRYCEELVLGGYDDWRLPSIDELRTLIRGNPDTETGGDCPVHDNSSKDAMDDETCAQIAEYGGPGVGGCYWVPELTGVCNKPDPADEGARPLETVSSTVASDDEFWVGCVLFDRGTAVFNHIYSLADVRCVRDGPTTPVTCAEEAPEACTPGETRQCAAANEKIGLQACTDNGSCWGPCYSNAFEPSPPIVDISATCDQVVLTLKVPEKLPAPPKMLMAFLYSVDDWTFPPNRPPDGGTDYNQVMDPVIDIDKPLTMTIPACSYYRDRCIPGGDYYLYVSLLQTDEWPPWPQEGDFSWGMEQEPLTLQTGVHQIIEKEIMLVPYGE
jgi:hypothetical protein